MKQRVVVLIALLSLSLFTGIAGVALAATLHPSVHLALNQSQFEAGDTMSLTLTTAPGTGDNNWDVYVALILPDGTLAFVTYEPLLNFSPALVAARPLRTIRSETIKVFEMTLPSGLPTGGWTWGAVLAKPDLSQISEISWSPFTITAVQPPAVDVTGTWIGTWRSTINTVSGGFVARITQQGSTLTGTIDIPWIGMVGSALKGTVSGTAITFGDVADEITFTGTVSGTESSSGTYVYPIIGDHGTWDAAKSAPFGGSCVDIEGTWDITEAVIDDTCGGGLLPQFSTYTMTQDGCNVAGIDIRGGTYQGTISGTQLSWTGSFPDSGGITAVTATSLTVSGDGNGITGFASWTWSDGSDGCSGTSRVTGTRQ